MKNVIDLIKKNKKMLSKWKFYFVAILLYAMTLCSCQKEAPKIYIKTSTISGFPKMEKLDTTTVVTSEYFEVGLYSYQDGHFTAKHELEERIDLNQMQNNRSKYFEIVENDSVKSFSGSTEFLNYMSERGYELVEQSKHKYRIDYTFKRSPK